MRRRDREVTDLNEIDKIITQCHCCRIGFYDKGEVYILPLNFGYSRTDSKQIFYFHSAKEGRKIELIRQNPKVGFELDCNYQLRTHSLACSHSASFSSIIGTGTLSFIEDLTEKRAALQQIMQHNTKKSDWKFDQSMVNSVALFKLQVSKISAKVHE